MENVENMLDKVLSSWRKLFLTIWFRIGDGMQNKEQGDELAESLKKYLQSRKISIIPNSSARRNPGETVFFKEWGGAVFAHINAGNQETRRLVSLALIEFSSQNGFYLFWEGERQENRKLVIKG